METRNYRLDLWKEFMERTPYIPEHLREVMGAVAVCYIDDTSFLSKVYAAFVERDRYLEDEENGVVYERDGEYYVLSHNGKECVFLEGEFKKILTGLLDLLEDTLPLGTVVDLKKEAYKEVEELAEVENIRIVITYRFLGKEENDYYFPYAGVVFPTGMMGRKEVLYFTRTLVDKVIHKGYTDEVDQAYVHFVKQELVIEKGKNTFGYATPEEIKKFNKVVKGDE